jgi:hypothetical protein
LEKKYMQEFYEKLWFGNVELRGSEDLGVGERKSEKI